MSNATISLASADPSAHSASSENFLATCIAGVLSSYFVLMACSLYWLTRAGATLFASVLPRSLIERAPMTWLLGSSLMVTVLTQAIPGFFPNYSDWKEIGLEVAVWLTLGLFARVYLVATSYPDTFPELRASIASRPLERLLAAHLHHPIDAIFTRVWLANSMLAAHLHHPIDAIFTRVWLANSIAIIPLSALLVLPVTINYLVIVGYTVMLLLTQLPQEITDHTNIHTRIFHQLLFRNLRRS